MAANAKQTTTKKAEEFASEAQQTAAQQVEKMSKGFEDVASFGQGTMDAMFKSGNNAAKHAEEMNAEMMTYSKRSMEEGVAAMKEMASAKTVSELVERQADYAKVSFDAFVKQAAKFNEMYLSAAKDVVEPLNGRAAAAADIAKANRA